MRVDRDNRCEPSAEEDERRLTRERDALVTERLRHVNRINGLLTTQGIFDFEPMHENRRKPPLPNHRRKRWWFRDMRSVGPVWSRLICTCMMRRTDPRR